MKNVTNQYRFVTSLWSIAIKLSFNKYFNVQKDSTGVCLRILKMTKSMVGQYLYLLDPNICSVACQQEHLNKTLKNNPCLSVLMKKCFQNIHHKASIFFLMSVTSGFITVLTLKWCWQCFFLWSWQIVQRYLQNQVVKTLWQKSTKIGARKKYI